MSKIELGLAILALLISAGSFSHSFIYTRKNERRLDSSETRQRELESRANRLEADLMFEKVRYKKEEFELSIAELVGSSEKGILVHLNAVTKFSTLFNEIEIYSTRLNDGTIPENDYVKKEIIPVLIKLARYQAEYFGSLNESAKNLSISQLKNPDYGSFNNFNSILQKHCKGNEYEKLKELRIKHKLRV